MYIICAYLCPLASPWTNPSVLLKNSILVAVLPHSRAERISYRAQSAPRNLAFRKCLLSYPPLKSPVDIALCTLAIFACRVLSSSRASGSIFFYERSQSTKQSHRASTNTNHKVRHCQHHASSKDHHYHHRILEHPHEVEGLWRDIIGRSISGYAC
jgi:hypothetical protein